MRFPLGAAVLIVALAGAAFRVLHLGENPGWDGDEGYNWSIASNLSAGHLQRFALRYTFVDHPPLFYLLGAALIRLWTADLVALRTLSAACGIATCGALFALGVRIQGRALGAAALGVYALWPLAILQTRWAYTYNLLAPLLVLAIWAALPTRAGERRTARYAHPLLAGALAGLALATDQEGASVVLTVCAVLWWRGGAWALLRGALAAAIAPGAYIGWMLASRRNAFLFDLRHTATRVGGQGPAGTLVELVVRLLHLLWFDPIILLGGYGLLLLPRGLGRRAVAAQAAVLLLFVLAVRDPVPYFRAAVPVLPLCALGAGALILRAIGWTRRTTSAGARRLAALVALATVGVVATVDLRQASGRYTTAIAQSLPHATHDARAMAGWVNARIRPGDVVLAMPQVAWLLHCRTAELLQAVAITGHGTEFYPSGLEPDRWAYDVHLTASRLLVIDAFTGLWVRGHPRERALVAFARARWPLVYRRGEYTVFANPAWSGSSPAIAPKR